MTYNAATVNLALATITSVNGGRAFVSPPISENVREGLYRLLDAYGVDVIAMERPTDNDLAIVYATARKSVVKGAAVAQRIERKYAHNPLLNITTPSPPPKPLPEPSPEPDDPYGEPYPPAPPPHNRPGGKPLDWQKEPLLPDMSKYVTRTDLAEVNERLTGRLNTFNEGLTERLNTLADKLTDVLRVELTEDLKAVAAELQTAVQTLVPQLVADAVTELQPVSLVVTTPENGPVPLGTVHYKTGAIIAALSAGVNVYLHGPAGSGKTTVAQKAAQAFGLQFYFAAKVESEYLLLGFKDARGETVRTQFREAYEHGGLFLFDELDGSSPQAVVALNAALANGVCPFPDAIITRHPDFKCIAAGNTTLSGASRQYTGRTQLDAASIDRFSFIEFGYDEILERALATDQAWVRYVQAARKAVADRGLTYLVTPRATLDGCKLLASGFDRDEVAKMVIWKGLDAETVAQIQRTIRVPLNPATQAA